MQTETNSFVRPIWMPTVQLAIGRRAVLQGEGSRWADGGATIRAGRLSEALGGTPPIRGNDLVGVARLTVTTVGTNLLYRVGSSKAAGFAGGGVHGRTPLAMRSLREPLVPLADPQRAVGRDTRIVGLDGLTEVGSPRGADPDRHRVQPRRSRHLAAADRGSPDRTGLAQCQERRAHRAADGVVLSFAIGCDTRGDDCSDRLAMVPITLPLLGGIGVGTGAGIGAMVNAAHHDRNLLYVR